MIDGIKICDAHMHYLGRFKDRGESLIEFMDRFGIDKAVVTTLNQEANLNAILTSDINIGQKEFLEKFVPKGQYNHDEVRKLVETFPERVYGFFWFNPKIATEEDWSLLETYLKEYNFRGVKTQCFVDLLKVPSDLFRLAEFCINKDVPLFVHSGAGFFFQKPVRAKDYCALAERFPDLKLIIGHAGYTMEYCINCLRYFARNKATPNVYFETSVSIPYAIMTLIKAMGADRVLYGSDSPTATTPDIEIHKIKILNLDRETQEKVFFTNTAHLIKAI